MLFDSDNPKRTVARPIPERIREAREGRGFTLESFAEALGVSKQAVAQYETGQTSPGGEVMRQIIRLTAQPLGFFTQIPHRYGAPTLPYWRSLKRMEQHHRRRIARRLQWASDIAAYLGNFIEMPPLNILRVDFDPDGDVDQQIESAAETLRDLWSLGKGPVRDLATTLEQNGIVLVREQVACPDMDGVSCWVGGRPYILLSDEVESGPRDLFNLAHELGHLLLHAGVAVNSDNLGEVERQANRFAGAFLLPRESFPQEVFGTSLAHFKLLKERWGVAIAAMAYRCKDLGIFTADQHSYLMKQMNYHRIRLVEPLDDAFEVSCPQLLRQAMEMVIDHGVQSRSQVESALGLNLRDVESLCGLPAGFLDTRILKFGLREQL